jgi:hypothetical protein
MGFLYRIKHGNLWYVDGHFESGSCSILNYIVMLWALKGKIGEKMCVVVFYGIDRLILTS